jgi:predicted acetyltransferase
MNVELEKVYNDKRYIIEKLMQLYLHELVLYFPMGFNSEICGYQYNLDKYFNDQHAYLIKDGSDILGFVFYNHYSDIHEISEIFILNNHKGQGIGEIAAKKIFDQFRGTWVIKAVPNSIKAENFWKKTINNYTNSNYEMNRTGKHDRAVFSFNNI